MILLFSINALALSNTTLFGATQSVLYKEAEEIIHYVLQYRANPSIKEKRESSKFKVLQQKHSSSEGVEMSLLFVLI